MTKIAKTFPSDSGRTSVDPPRGGSDNPFAVSTELTGQRGVFGDASRRVRSALLYREIEFGSPFAGLFVYSGWWFRQKIVINGQTVWFRISWMQIFRHAAFTIPHAAVPPQTEKAPRVDILPRRETVPDQTPSPKAAIGETSSLTADVKSLTADAKSLTADVKSLNGKATSGRAAEPGVPGRIEIDFTRGLTIRRFRLWIGDELVYDEIN